MKEKALTPRWAVKVRADMAAYQIYQYEIANEIGSSPTYISGIMNGRRSDKKMKPQIIAAMKTLIERKRANA